MNSIDCIVEKISRSGKVYLLELSGGKLHFNVLILESDLAHTSSGQPLKMLFKETEVSIGKSSALEISLANRIPGQISSLEKGELISRVVLDTAVGKVNSIITTRSVEKMGLDVGVEAVGYIKTNDIMLAKP
jgi:molybdate transport system regulatory protein